MTFSVQSLLGQSPSSQPLIEYLNGLSSDPAATEPEVKSYPDVVYYNFYALGLSLLFKPIDGYKPEMGLIHADLTESKLVLESLDIYNTPKDTPARVGSKKKAETAFATHPVSPVTLDLVRGEESFQITRENTGKDFVHRLGEPDRKGGGSGPSSGSIGIWCEWTRHGMLVEFGGVEATGPQAWERGKDAVWRVITVFLPDAKT